VRVLFTCIPVISHFYPLVPVARALADAGHDVTFATHAILAPAIEHPGFRHVAAGFAFSSPQVADLLAEAGKRGGEELQPYTWTHGFAGALASRVAGDLLAMPDARDADLIVRDNTELGGCIAAERLGLPHAAISVLSTGMTPGARVDCRAVGSAAGRPRPAARSGRRRAVPLPDAPPGSAQLSRPESPPYRSADPPGPVRPIG
jgi:hypothetical protein